MQDIDLGQVRVRTWRNWMEDGIQELLGGAFMAIWGALELTPQPYYRYLVGLGIPLLGVGFAIWGRGLIVRVKERTSFPRTGYAVARRPAAGRVVAALVLTGALIYGLGWLGAVLRTAGWREPGARLVALVVAIAWIGMGLWYSFRRLLLYGLLALALGLGLPVTAISPGLWAGLFMLILGLAAMLGGSLALRRVLRRAAPPAEA
jgi:hypothetical protein